MQKTKESGRLAFLDYRGGKRIAEIFHILNKK
jgi:hypothetical protein